MDFKNIKIKAIADRVMNRAVKSGFKKVDLEDFYIESLLKQTTSPRIKEFIELAYYKGIFKGFQYSETLLHCNITQTDTNGKPHEIQLSELQKENINLVKRLESLNDIVFKIKEPPQSTGKIIQDGRSFVSYRNNFKNDINDAIKMVIDNNKFLNRK